MINLTLVIPVLFREEINYPPTLKNLLNQSIPLENQKQANSIDELFFQLFGLDSSEPLPIAAVTYSLDSKSRSNSGWWMRADPVYLHINRNNLILYDQRSFQINHDEAISLAAEITNLNLQILHPTRWYLNFSEPPLIETTNLDVVNATNPLYYLPQGTDSKNWHKLLNECQIILHNSVINENRIARGEPPINSLWFWGGGYPPKITASHPINFDHVWSNHPTVLGLAHFLAIDYSDSLDKAKNWLNNNRISGNYLIVLDELSTALPMKELADLEQEWMQPLKQALITGKLDNLYLYLYPAPPCQIMINKSWLKKLKLLIS